MLKKNNRNNVIERLAKQAAEICSALRINYEPLAYSDRFPRRAKNSYPALVSGFWPALPGIIIFTILVFSSSAFALDEINRKIELKENHSHLLCFKEKIIRYKTGSEDAFEVEILSDIYDKRHEMLIKPLKAVNSNLIVWTKKQIYNFDISVQKINKGYEGFEAFELDLPPGLE